MRFVRSFIAPLAFVLIAIVDPVVPTPWLSMKSRPVTPVFTDPANSETDVSPTDVHMITTPFSDADGDPHLATDWEIWTGDGSERVWFALNDTAHLEHTHLGDGTFAGRLQGKTELAPETTYQIRARYRDNSADPATEWSHWSPWARFTTAGISKVLPLFLEDVLDRPEPIWQDEEGAAVVLPQPHPSAYLAIRGPSDAFYLLQSGDGSSNRKTNFPALSLRQPVAVHVHAGEADLVLPASQLLIQDQQGRPVTIYLPAISLRQGQELWLWVSATGATYFGSPTDAEPQFAQLARGAPVPWLAPPGYKVQVAASGFTLPVNIAFIPDPRPELDAPLYYVTELYGQVKVVRGNGAVSTYASNLLNFNPLGQFPGSGEMGVTGIVVEPKSGDLFVGAVADDNGNKKNRILRLHSDDGGLTMSRMSVVLDNIGVTQASHQIGALTIGPDGKLYAHIGDGLVPSTALDDRDLRGKILRLNLDGTIPPDNPTWSLGRPGYVFAKGFRNAFGGAWRPDDNQLYAVENGNKVDRLVKVRRGQSYGWAGSDTQMRIGALYLWDPSVSPTAAAFLNGPQFPASKLGHLFVATSGPTYASGPQLRGKKVQELVLNADGTVQGNPTTFCEYLGTGRSTCVGMAFGPDGLYFTTLYRDEADTPIEPGASVMRIVYTGIADFAFDQPSGVAPLEVRFSDLSTAPDPSHWLWNFGDGSTSNEQNPSHTYIRPGNYTVTLNVTGRGGTIARRRALLVIGRGDINTDGAFNVQDLVLLIQHLSGTVNLTGTSSIAADVNADGFADVADLVRAIQALLGISPL